MIHICKYLWYYYYNINYDWTVNFILKIITFSHKWRYESALIRERFEKNRNQLDLIKAKQLLLEGERELEDRKHPYPFRCMNKEEYLEITINFNRINFSSFNISWWYFIWAKSSSTRHCIGYMASIRKSPISWLFCKTCWVKKRVYNMVC